MSTSVSLVVTTVDVPKPAGSGTPAGYKVFIENSAGSTVRAVVVSSLVDPVVFDIANLAAGSYVAKAQRNDTNDNAIGTPASQAFTLDTTVTLPSTITVNLS